jgi:hypothetical protein
MTVWQAWPQNVVDRQSCPGPQLFQLPALEPQSEADEHQADDGERGGDQIRENARVGIDRGLEQVDDEEKEKRKKTARNNDKTRKTEPVAKDRQPGAQFFGCLLHVRHNL